jgi:hypothetical protein
MVPKLVSKYYMHENLKSQKMTEIHLTLSESKMLLGILVAKTAEIKSR